ncbi:zinc finger domain-containing protein [Mycobacteroides abscessus]|uniref:zinc finger domain-containing protein n=1 Tax=Mycobacteroides abscessus TaxID=36809 RepID=UPI003B3A5CFB
MADFEDVGRRDRPDPYSITGAHARKCSECGAPEGESCTFNNGIKKHLPHWSRWRSA